VDTNAWEPVLLGRGLEGSRWDTLQFVTCAALEDPERGQVKVSNFGFYPSEATFTCSGMRIMAGARTLQCLPDGSWQGEPPTCYAMLQLIVILSVVLVVDAAAFIGYYYCVILRRAPPLQPGTFIPEESMYRWSHELLADVKDDPKLTCLQFLFCPCCRVADTWRSMGQLPFSYGAPLLHLFLPLLPCLGTYFRQTTRARLNIRGSRLGDFVVWLCCCPCAAVQEARVADVLVVVCAEEAEAMRQDRLRKREILESQHKASLEASSGRGRRPSTYGRPQQEPHAQASTTEAKSAPPHSKTAGKGSTYGGSAFDPSNAV